MKGKKTDTIFVSNFIQDCVSQGIDKADQIVAKAKSQIQDIDFEIQAIEHKKIIRSKLLDIVYAFEKPNKKQDQAKLLPFFRLKYPDLCRKLCQKIGVNPMNANEVNWEGNDSFVIKQLIDCKVLTMISNQIVPGEKYDDYSKLVLGN